tara:strand:- start:135 stop:479 length:345 start_codon:yes stop_codon:yes gene_type:complete
MTILGIPGASDPSFRTTDRIFVSLDQLVSDVVGNLQMGELDLSLHVAKCVIQLTRRRLSQSSDVTLESLSVDVRRDLRTHRVMLTEPQVKLILSTYGDVFSTLDIAEVVNRQSA